MAMTGNRDNDTPVQPQSERSERRRQWGQPFVEILPGVKGPWSWYAASRLTTSLEIRGVEDKWNLYTYCIILRRSQSEQNI